MAASLRVPRWVGIGGALLLFIATALTSSMLWMTRTPLQARQAAAAGLTAAPLLLPGGMRGALESWTQPELLAADGGLQGALGSALRRLRSGEARVVLYHVHKSGGSSLCNALVAADASLMGCMDEHKDAVVADRRNAWCNCNGHRDLVPSVLATGSPSEVQQYLAARRPAAFFVEDGVADEPYWGPAAVHVMIVRHPIDRYISHMLHVLTKDDNRSLDSIDISAEVLRHSRRPPGDGGGIVDNYLTRFAAGWTALGRPTKAGVWGVGEVPPLTPALFLRALRNLGRMQVVLALEDIEPAGPLLQALGLPPYSADMRAGTNFSTSGLSYSRRLSPEALAHVEAQHKWDSVLYAWCRQRHARTLQAFAHLRAQGGQRQEDRQQAAGDESSSRKRRRRGSR